MSQKQIFNYMKWLIKTGRKDTIANFKMFKESLT